MDFNDTPEEASFRKEVNDWLSSNASLKKSPQDSGMAGMGEEDALKNAKKWAAKLYESGWSCLHWPKEYGGRGSTPIERVIWGQEASKYKVPGGFFEIGQGMAGPVLMMYATEDQKKRYLPPMAKGEEVWCQLFSEPGAGSDLAGLKTKAVLDGDTWTINGQKIWTSGAHYSDYGILVTRSDPTAQKHKGLTYFFLDMKSPGVEVRPIKQISGGANFNEVYFTDVKIPDEQRLGSVGDGWKVALTTLMNERLAVGDASGPDFQEAFNLACGQDLNGDLAIKDGSVRDKLADWYCQSSGLKYTKYRNISALSRGETPGPQASITKIVSGNKLQEIANFGMDIMDAAGIVRPDSSGAEQNMYQMGFFGAAGIRIAGGTDEILKNIISEQVLGLPQDMRADKGIPFNEIPSSNK
ncbi:MAG: acyl-CoA dehydrogenase family protein [Pseudomonadota bacterium]|nr:acyl-CoA dehydrogenase family protein [Pseudomonadota bacterium]